MAWGLGHGAWGKSIAHSEFRHSGVGQSPEFHWPLVTANWPLVLVWERTPAAMVSVLPMADHWALITIFLGSAANSEVLGLSELLNESMKMIGKK